MIFKKGKARKSENFCSATYGMICGSVGNFPCICAMYVKSGKNALSFPPAILIEGGDARKRKQGNC